MSGFHLYARVAPFAECSQFPVPPHTGKLCQSSPIGSRYGPEYYEWILSAPVRHYYPLSPATSQTVGTFAKEVLMHEPGEYLKAVSLDMARYIEPSLGSLPGGFGESHSLMSFSNFNPQLEKQISAPLATHYSGVVPPSTRWLADLGRVQDIVRVGPVVLLLLIAAVLGGLFFGKGKTKGGLWAISALTLLLYLGPVATFTYDIRYGVPPQAFLALAAALGVQSMCTRVGLHTARSIDPVGASQAPCA